MQRGLQGIDLAFERALVVAPPGVVSVVARGVVEDRRREKVVVIASPQDVAAVAVGAIASKAVRPVAPVVMAASVAPVEPVPAPIGVAAVRVVSEAALGPGYGTL